MVNRFNSKNVHAVAYMLMLATAALSCSSVATANPGGPHVVLTSEQQRQLRVRAEFGLDTSVSHLLGSERTYKDTAELGIPLSSEEAATMRERDKLPAVINRVERSLDQLGLAKAYAGAWTDQAKGGQLHLAFRTSESTADIAARLSSRIPSSVSFVVDDVPFTMRELEAGRSAIVQALDSKALWTRWFAMDELNEKENRVILTVNSNTPRRVREHLNAIFRSGPVTVRLADVAVRMDSRDHASGPLYGGEWIYGGAGNCTAGYGHSRGGPGDEKHYYLITAGHCGNYKYYQGKGGRGNYFGSAHNNGMLGKSSSACDCVAVGPLPSSAVTNKVYITNTSLYTTYGRTATTSDYHAGNKLCLSGALYADNHAGSIKCNTIQGSTADIKYQDANFTLKNAFTTHITDAQSGDSGGPYGSGIAFLGIHAATLRDLNNWRTACFCGIEVYVHLHRDNTTPTY